MTESIPLGTALRVWVTTDAYSVTITCPPYWQQRFTLAEAIGRCVTCSGPTGRSLSGRGGILVVAALLRLLPLLGA